MSVPAHQRVDAGVFDAVRQILIARTGKGLMTEDVKLINLALALDDPPVPMVPQNVVMSQLTPQVLLELFGHEAIVQEMYLDSVKVETWSAGLTAKSGINVRQYKDNPQSLQVCVNAVVDRLRKVYVPAVLGAFKGRALTSAQFAAALSFDYNTGAIGRADWVKLWLAGRTDEAYASFMNWKSPPEIIERRKKERDLFFAGKWSNDGKVAIIGVRKPSYNPNWASTKRVSVTAEINKALGL
jgi:lysozyme